MQTEGLEKRMEQGQVHADHGMRKRFAPVAFGTGERAVGFLVSRKGSSRHTQINTQNLIFVNVTFSFQNS